VATDEHDDVTISGSGVATSGDEALTSQTLPSPMLLLFLGASEDCKLQLLEFPAG